MHEKTPRHWRGAATGRARSSSGASEAPIGLTVDDVLPARTSWRLPVLLLCGFALAVGLRVLIGGVGVAQSATAGLLFGALLTALSLAAGARVPLSWRAVLIGLVGAIVLCLPVLWGRAGPLQPADGFASWAVVVALVSAAEELFLRGALYDAVARMSGTTVAVVIGAAAFAALHVPLYGWRVVPLDFAVGVVLGELRRSSGTPLAPAVAHVGADWAGWFLR